jgi:hypothetical protein
MTAVSEWRIDYAVKPILGLGGHGVLIVRDELGNIVLSLEGISVDKNGEFKPIGWKVEDSIKARVVRGATQNFDPTEPAQTLFRGPRQEVMEMVEAARVAADAINRETIGYPVLGVFPTPRSKGVSNSNAVIATLAVAMGLEPPRSISLPIPGSTEFLLDQETLLRARSMWDQTTEVQRGRKPPSDRAPPGSPGGAGSRPGAPRPDARNPDVRSRGADPRLRPGQTFNGRTPAPDLGVPPPDRQARNSSFSNDRFAGIPNFGRVAGDSTREIPTPLSTPSSRAVKSQGNRPDPVNLQTVSANLFGLEAARRSDFRLPFSDLPAPLSGPEVGPLDFGGSAWPYARRHNRADGWPEEPNPIEERNDRLDGQQLMARILREPSDANPLSSGWSLRAMGSLGESPPQRVRAVGVAAMPMTLRPSHRTYNQLMADVLRNRSGE